MTCFIPVLHRAFSQSASKVLDPVAENPDLAVLVQSRAGKDLCFLVMQTDRTRSVFRGLSRNFPCREILYSNFKLHLSGEHSSYFVQRHGLLNVGSMTKDKTRFYACGLKHAEAFGLTYP